MAEGALFYLAGKVLQLLGSIIAEEARSGGGLSELKQLNNLGGSLVIKNLGHGKDDMVECNATDMKEKQYLQELQLWWDDGESECYDEMSLEGLQPHPNLKMLRLSHYMGMRIPSWVSSLNNLVHFELYKNRRLQHLPSLNQLPFLKSVFLYEMEALEYIWIGEDNVSNMLGGSSFTSSSKTAFFPSLSSLVLMDCPNLKGWWRNSGDDDNEPHHLLLPSFPPSLFHLQIGRCPNLTYMPLIPDLTLKGSIIYGCPLLVLEQTMKMGASTSTYFPLSQLEDLELYWINDLKLLPKERLQNIISLRELYIKRYDGLGSLPWIGILTSVLSLNIWECPKLTSLPQGIHNLTSLKELGIDNCPNLTSLPRGSRNLTFKKVENS
ncbi:putative disease resistance protein rga1 [Quercus suber]|uniref:Disease resistance protein rga1 n=1 Tax=Quercus suber TaxID=58331 RepID=A0AAW0LDC5_QUESU